MPLTPEYKDFHPAKFHRPDVIHQTLYVITPIINSQRFRTRWKHFKSVFEHQVINAGAHLLLIEASFGEREEVFIETISPMETIIHVKVVHELWLKENLINRAIQHLNQINPEWKYVAYVDADVQFARPDWVGETLHQLQHFHCVQMFSQIANLSPDNEILSTNISFMEGWRRGIPFQTKAGKAQDDTYKNTIHHCPPSGHPYDHPKHGPGWAGSPGGAWAYRREAINHLGGLIDFAILGSADYHMATALMGFLNISVQKGYHPEYIQWLKDWEFRALSHIKRNVGHVKGLILHHFHGKVKDRKYGDRWKILVKHQFNPRVDIKRDSNGIYQLAEETGKWQLRDDVRSYFNQRNEDSIDI